VDGSIPPQHSITSSASFYEKLNFVIKCVHSKDYNIGPEPDWQIIKAVLKEYRNYVHLTTYVSAQYPLDEEAFIKVKPVFLSLIKKF
jgi:hypothetical protein